MDEARLREIAAALREELDEVIEDEEQRAQVSAQLDAALKLPGAVAMQHFGVPCASSRRRGSG